jgi:hypothetical protein
MLAMLPSCAAGVTLAGDEDVVASVLPALETRRIATGESRCVRASLAALTDGSIGVEIEDGGRGVLREAENAEGAATIIESWVRRDVTDPLLDRRAPAPELEIVEGPVRPASAQRNEVAPDPDREPRSFALGIGPVFGVGLDDGSTWLGFEASGCARVWRLCAGGRFQYARDLGTGGVATELAASRHLLDGAITVELPLALGAFELIPGIGIGASNVRSKRSIGGVPDEEDAWAFRANARAGATYRISDRLSGRLAASFDFVPGGKSRVVADDGIEHPGIPAFAAWLRLGLEIGGL